MLTGLTTGLRALLSSQVALDTIGHNIANANTPGYSRQRAELAAAMPANLRGLVIGQGVEVASVTRSVDVLLQRRILLQVSVSGRLDAQLGHMSEVEAFFAEPSDSAIGALMDGFFGKLTDLSGSPADPVLRSGAVQSASELAARIRDLSSTLSQIEGGVAGELELEVGEVNRLAQEISELNLRIAESTTSGAPSSDLADQRDLALRELAELADIQVFDASNGRVRVTVAGNTLVGATQAYAMELATDANGEFAFRIEGASGFVPISGGTIGGLLEFQNDFTPRYASDLDELARNLIREINREHTTGIPPAGGFQRLVGDNPPLDQNGDGDVTGELLANAGLPFEVADGVLRVNVTDSASGTVTPHEIEIDEEQTTVGDFLDALNAIPELSASLDPEGRVLITADAGTLFDFSARLPQPPDPHGVLGGGKASLGTAGTGPFALADGDTLDLAVGGSSFTIAFSAADFDSVSQADAAEVAAVIDADPGAQANGIEAVAVGGRLFLQSQGAGASESFDLAGGNALGALGWSALAGTSVTGSDNAVEIAISGSFTGSGAEELLFVPNMDGAVGTTPGLAVEVFDKNGNLLATLDVGEGYEPGTELSVAHGITASFGLGEPSSAHNDSFALELTSNSDSADVLLALGLNSFFSGTGASDIAVRRDLELDPSLLASSATGSEGDNGALLAILEAQTASVEELGGLSINLHYSQMVGSIGFDVSSAEQALAANETLVMSLDVRHEEISGVNMDEELVNLLEFEQAFAAAAQYISVVSSLGEELLGLI